jgi:hypothetical protein
VAWIEGVAGVFVAVGLFVGETVALALVCLVTIVVLVGLGLGLTLPSVMLQADNKTSKNTAHRRYVIVFFILIPPLMFLRMYYLLSLLKLC